jgi:hypothetical protein
MHNIPTNSPTTGGLPGASLSFCWGHVPATDEGWLRQRTADLERIAERVARDLIAIGKILIEVANRLPRYFSPWLAAKTPFSPAHAYRLMGVAKAFAPYVSLPEKVDSFDRWALYLLAQEKTPKAAREHALQLAEKGERITKRLAKEILDAHRTVKVSQQQTIEMDDEIEELHLYRDRDGKRINQDAITAQQEAQDAERARKIGKTVCDLAERADLVTVTRVDDAEDVILYSVTFAFDGNAPRNVVDRDLLRALQRAVGVIETKYCPGCCAAGEEIPTEQFGANKRMPDLLMTRCKCCERSRKKERRERLRKERKKSRGGVKREAA